MFWRTVALALGLLAPVAGVSAGVHVAGARAAVVSSLTPRSGATYIGLEVAHGWLLAFDERGGTCNVAAVVLSPLAVGPARRYACQHGLPGAKVVVVRHDRVQEPLL